MQIDFFNQGYIFSHTPTRSSKSPSYDIFANLIN